MTEHQLRRLCSRWQRRLGFGRWNIELRIEACEEADSFMEVQRQVAYERAILTVQPWALTGRIPEGVIELELTDRHIEQQLVHELLHLFTTGMQGVIEDDLDGQLHRDVYSVVRSAFRREEERAVDALSVALVQNWPL